MPQELIPWYSIRRRTPVAAAAQGVQAASSAEIYIYGDIGDDWWNESVTAADFVRALNSLDVEAITVRVNSVGGSAPDGIAIHNALKRHPATITVSVDGIAASISAFIAMAGDVVEMAENTMMMVHGGHTAIYGNAQDHRDAAAMLDQWNAAMANSFATKTGRPVAEMLTLITDGKDHWYTAAEALDAKLIDQITPPMQVSASLVRGLPAARLNSAPAAVLAHFQIAASPAPVAAPAASPASASAVKPPKEEPMPKTAEELAAEKARQDAVKAALDADIKRRQDVRAALAPFAKRPELAPQIQAIQDSADIDTTVTVDQVNAKVLALISASATPAAGSYVATLEDEADKQRAGVRAALEIRAGLAKNDTANPFRGYTLSEIARATLERCGVKTGTMDKMGMVAAAFTHSTSDFGNLLMNVANKSMMKGYEEAGETFQLWTSKGSLPDFKAAMRVDLNTFPTLLKVAEGAEYKYATIGDRGEQVQLATYGRLFSITRQVVINDDLDAMVKLPRLMGRAAIRTVGDLVYAILTSNPLMSDGVALFHATHANLAAAGSVISTGSVDAQQVLMATQKDGAAVLNIQLAHLLVPVALRGLANTVRNSEYEVGASSKNNTTPNFVRETFDVIAEPRLDAASATAWYGVANSATTDTIEVSYLDGNETPTLEQQAGWSVDGTEFKVRMDAGVKALSFRGLSKNPGA